jgi:LmbE family N-acetylglucosaminyl deacetylase
MKLLKFSALFLLLFSLVFIAAHIIYVYGFSPREKFPYDTYLSAMDHKKALAIVAHDDDLAFFAGTFAILREMGWEVDYVSFYKGKNDDYEILRKGELKKVSAIQGFKNLFVVDFEFLINPDAEQTYMPVPYENFETHFKMDSLRLIFREIILESKPAVIFSLDDVIGGYGHPEHIIVGQSIISVSKTLKEERLWNVEKVYQGVFPHSHETAVNKNLPVYREALKIYHPDGMPDPDVQIHIKKHHKEKMAVLKSYASQHRNIKKFAVYYHYYPSWLYFRIFDREFFRVVEI